MKNFLATRKKLVIILVILIVLGLGAYKFFWGKKQSAPQYLTTAAQQGTLVESVSASGQITTGDSVAILTQSSGVVKDVLVKNGDSVTQGELIADLTLDQSSQQKQEQAYSSLLSAQNSLASVNANLNTLQNSEFTANQKFINDAVARNLATNDPTYIEEDAAWLAAEANYKNQQQVIAQAQVNLVSTQLAYQQITSTITAPASGTISGLTITPGTNIAASSSTSGSSSNSSTPTTVGTVAQSGPIQAEVNLAEIDAVNVSPGQRATLTLDAFPNKTFTGRVLIINTNGVVSSGVTTYPAIIAFDTSENNIYPNMGVTANIITKVDNNVLLIPSSAIQSTNGQSIVRVLSNSQVQNMPVEIGDSNDTETEITSGLSAGQNVVTAVVNSSSTPSGATTSPFSGTGGRGFGGGGAVLFRSGGGGGRGG